VPHSKLEVGWVPPHLQPRQAPGPARLQVG
jgi:hypothetical protein